MMAGNVALTEGSGLHFSGDAGGGRACPVVGTLLHNTIADNAGSGQGVFVDKYATHW